ncbi:MAG: alpha/beta fold hydrolase [Chitinophagaceae bacterium]|nr:MAG: alpha/beta fold hydrolase [Chitinophagaceae bacterium]
MSKQIFFLFFTLSISVILYCQTVEGYWRGAVSRDGSIQITELLIEKNAGGLKALYSLPDLGLFEQSADLVFKTDTSFTLKIFMGVFECLLHEDIQEVTGVNNNWKPVGLKLHLKKMSTPPKSYTQTLVDVKAATGTTLKGTLFTPTRTGKRPLVIIAHGAENPTRTNWVYTSYAYFLAEQGFAVYVFDQRAHGLSGGSTEATLEDHAADIISIAAFFSKASFIDQRNISILGESRGGWAAVLAAARSKIFSSIVLLAGPAKSPIDLEPDVVFATLKKDGYSASAIDSAMRYTDLYFKTVKDSGLYTRLTQQYEVIKNRPWAHVLQTPEREGLLWWKKQLEHTGNA